MPSVVQCAVVTTTLDSESAARDMAQAVVEARLAACAQIIPISSIYRWKGAVESAHECAVTMKTASERSAELMRFIRARHPYETPEIVVTPILDGWPDYLRWIFDETRPETHAS